MFPQEDGSYGRDSYGQVKVRVTEDCMGNVLLHPISERRRQEVSRSNQYDGACHVYMSDSQHIQDFMSGFPRATYKDHNGQVRINDGCVILIDSWTFRHMAGGQSD